MSISTEAMEPVPPSVAALLHPEPTTGLLFPAYGGRSLPNVAATVARAAGAGGEGSPPIAPSLAADLDPFSGRPPAGPIVVMIVDGFGWHPFYRWADRSRGGAGTRWGRLAAPITTVFPTTTVPALVSLSTATAPGQNGVVGYRQFLPRYGVVADLLTMSPVGVTPAETLVGPDWSPRFVSGAASVFRRGVVGTALSRDKFEGRGLTRLLYDGAPYVGYATASDLAHHLTQLIDRPDPPPVIYTYWDELDAVHHRRGPQDRLFDFEADRLAHLLEYVAAQVSPSRARSTTVLVTADHGHVAVDPDQQLRVDQVPEIAEEMARPLAGDRRSGYFAALPGRESALREALERHLPPGSRILSTPEAVSAGLFGPPPHHPELRLRLGDLIALVPVPSGLISLPPGGRPSRHGAFLGGHGGLTPEELLVPLVRGRLEEFGRAADPPPREAGGTVKSRSR